MAPSIAERAAAPTKVQVVDTSAVAAPEAPAVEALPQRPYTVRLPPAQPRSGRWKLLAMALGAAGIVGVALLLRHPSTDLPVHPTTSASSTAAAAPGAISPAPPSAVVSTAVLLPGACPATCCGGTACTGAPSNARGCSSGRTCVPGSCDSRISPSGDWLLRVVGASANGKEISPRPEVCLRRTTPRGNDPWSCTPTGTADPRATRLHITTAELAEGGVDLSINRSPKGPSIIGKGVHMGGIGVAALCKGLNFRFAGTDHLAYAVTIFLDDASEGDAGPP